MSERSVTPDLRGRIAVVTGASRGVGKGIALGLGEAGATVYVTGRTIARDNDGAALPGSIGETAAAISQLGGRGVALRCDHASDVEVEATLDRMHAEAGRIDILVNNAFAIPDGDLYQPFWELPIEHWDLMHSVGLRSHYIASVFAARRMISQCSGLIVNVSSFGAQIYAINVAYGVGKAGVDRMSRDMARELKPFGITALSLWPGVVRTERLEREAERFPFDRSNSESPQLSGRAVAHLAADGDVQRHTGQALVVAELAEQYGFFDLDGTRPRSLRK